LIPTTFLLCPAFRNDEEKVMADDDLAVLERYVPFCPKCGNECEQKELRRALDADSWKKIVIETIFYCKRCDNYWSDGLVEKGYK
jgi:NADH pyrophosphatase NudC (nudix superfamily)